MSPAQFSHEALRRMNDARLAARLEELVIADDLLLTLAYDGYHDGPGRDTLIEASRLLQIEIRATSERIEEVMGGRRVTGRATDPAT